MTLPPSLLDDARDLGGQFFDLLGARILTREKYMLIKRHGSPFLVGADPGGKPFEPFGKDSKCSEGGNTGRRTVWPYHNKIQSNDC